MNLEQKQTWMRERQEASRSARDPYLPRADFAQKHFSVAEIATLWELSADFVRKIFINEPGVIVFGDESKPGTRRYRTLRIPESVVAHVHKRLTNKESSKC
ncbi:MAG: hypothetical protein P4N24_13530 [Acidobacteriota bacterium]|nr:hypothetical protein [Acidobacteriota bacterium]